eukprot:737358_1
MNLISPTTDNASRARETRHHMATQTDSPVCTEGIHEHITYHRYYRMSSSQNKPNTPIHNTTKNQAILPMLMKQKPGKHAPRINIQAEPTKKHRSIEDQWLLELDHSQPNPPIVGQCTANEAGTGKQEERPWDELNAIEDDMDLVATELGLTALHKIKL